MSKAKGRRVTRAERLARFGGRQGKRSAVDLDSWLENRVEYMEREGARYLEEATATPSAYELRNMGSGHGMPIDLGDTRHGVFWSRGFFSCDACHDKLSNAESARLKPYYEKKNGIIKAGRSCTGLSSTSSTRWSK